MRFPTAALASVLSTTLAFAGTPFGGDDTGFVPPDITAYNCESKALLANAKLRQSIGKCHIDLAAQRFKGSSATDEGCETAAQAKFNATLNKVFNANACPACLVSNTTGMADAVETEMDGSNGDFYCEGSTPFGDDDTGFVPSDAAILKCESGTLKNVQKYLACIQKCHRKMAGYALKGKPFDEEACEKTDPTRSCLAKYNRYRDKLLPLCPSCLDQAAHDQLAADTEAFADGTLGTFYCASPSGAFLDLP
jgi:hypothetical protein